MIKSYLQSNLPFGLKTKIVTINLHGRKAERNNFIKGIVILMVEFSEYFSAFFRP